MAWNETDGMPQAALRNISEVKTGKRRVIEYFLSQLAIHGSESLRER
jgi:hypothetical protein